MTKVNPSNLMGALAEIAIPFWCTITVAFGALEIVPLTASLITTFGHLAVMWAQVLLLACVMLVAGVIIKLIKQDELRLFNLPLYVWFLYPSYIVAGIMFISYTAALFNALGFAAAFLPAGLALAIGARFIFKWLQMHLKWIQVSKDSDTSKG